MKTLGEILGKARFPKCCGSFAPYRDFGDGLEANDFPFLKASSKQDLKGK
jgi:hypothetical protein